jgi:hypothetical protein
MERQAIMLALPAAIAARWRHMADTNAVRFFGAFFRVTAVDGTCTLVRVKLEG